MFAFVFNTNLRTNILCCPLDSRLSRHPGIHRTLAVLAHLYRWLGLLKVVETYAKACMVCTQIKSPDQAPAGPLLLIRSWRTPVLYHHGFNHQPVSLQRMHRSLGSRRKLFKNGMFHTPHITIFGCYLATILYSRDLLWYANQYIVRLFNLPHIYGRPL